MAKLLDDEEEEDESFYKEAYGAQIFNDETDSEFASEAEGALKNK